MMRSRIAGTATILYLLAFACAAVYPHFKPDQFAGVFVVMLALPWIEYFPTVGLFGAAALNALIIYSVFAAIVGWIARIEAKRSREAVWARLDISSDLILRSALLRASRRTRFGRLLRDAAFGRSDPASRQELEAFDARRPLDDLDCPTGRNGKCVDELFAAIHPVGKDVDEREGGVATLQQGDGAMDILNVGGMNVDGEQKTIGVGDDMSLPPINALARVKAGWAAGLRRRGTLAVDDSGSRRWLASELSSCLPDQGSDDFEPPAGISPGIKIALDSRVGRELARQRSPLAAGG